MPGNILCPGCGAALPPSALAGLCPRCSLKGALDLGRKEVGAPPSPSPRARLGPRFGDFELLELLGRGGMGAVYKAHQYSLNQEVALKMLLDSKQGSAQAVRRFQLEAEVAARLRHPNIVRIYQIGEEDGEQFFTMELIEGQSLSRQIAKGSFRVTSEGRTKASVHQVQNRIGQFMATVARAVDYAHEQGVLHRDIKPGNILVDRNGEPHLTDFGLAKLGANAVTTVSDSVSVAGTPAYMAPEQARGERLTRAADIYSLGVVLYELLSGKPPFSAATPLETLRLVTDQEPANPSATSRGLIDADLATIALKCLEKNPSARYGSAGELADDLERWLRRESIHARPAGQVERIGRWARRNPVGASFIVVLVLGVMATSFLLFRLASSQKELQSRADNIRDGIIASIERLWGSTNRQFEFIPSEQLSAFLTTPKAVVDYDAPHSRMTVAVSVTESPISQAIRYAPPLAQLESRMTELLGRRVLLDLKLFKFNSKKLEAAALGEVDFSTLGAFAYVQAKAKQPGLTPIVRESLFKPAVIFARSGIGITNLNQCAGRRLALGDEGATISMWAKVHLARVGLLGTNLVWSHYDSKQAFLDRLRREGIRKLMKDRANSHAGAIEAVLNGEADIGVAREDYAQDFARRGLKIIYRFESTPQLWVASANTKREEVDAFRRAFLDSRTIEMVGGPDRNQVARMMTVDDAFFDSVREVVTNEVARFEGRRRIESVDAGDDE